MIRSSLTRWHSSGKGGACHASLTLEGTDRLMPEKKSSIKWFKQIWEAAHQTRFGYELLEWAAEWLGFDNPIKAILIFIGPSIGTILAYFGNLPAYQIVIVALGALALSGVGV